MGIMARLRRTLSGNARDAEIDEELRFHLEMDMADGHQRREARLRLGNVAALKEDTRAMGIVEWLESALNDARFGARQLRKSPAVTVAVIVSLAIGIGANTAIFSLIDAALLKPLPVADPDSLVILEWTNGGFPPSSLITNHNGEYRTIAGGRKQGSSVPAYLYRRLAREQSAFNTLIGLAAYTDGVAISGDTFPVHQISLQYVSSNYFQGLGAAPALGRPFLAEEDTVGAEPAVIVSHRFWTARLHGDGSVLGRIVRINTVPARIVGVAPPGFFGLRPGQWPDVYAPIATKVAFQPNPAAAAPHVEDDRNWWIRQVGRTKAGVSAAEATRQISQQFRRLVAAEAPSADPGQIPELVSLPGRRGFEALNPTDTRALWILMLLVGVLLLLVCTNVANLLLSRSVGRARESAIRLALGAARGRLFRQHLIESGVLALLGGAAGLTLGSLSAQAIHLMFQSGRDASSAFDLHLGARVLIYTTTVSMLAALLFGLAPAIRAARSGLDDVLKARMRSVVADGLRLPRVLVSVQIALCLTALVAAGLLGRSLDRLQWLDIGFDRDRLSYVTLSPSRAGYSAERVGPYLDRVRAELSGLPGVLRVAPVQTRLLSGGGNNGRVGIPGQPWDDSHRANLNRVGEGFFETMAMPIMSGRAFDRRDLQPDARVVIVDALFASRYFPNQDPIGRRIALDQEDGHRYEIVGVVGNTLYNSMRREVFPTVYEPYRPGGTIHIAIRSTVDAARLADAILKTVASVDPTVPVTEFHTQAGLIDRMLRTERLLRLLSGALGVVALTLSAVGLAGLLAYAVARRTSEIGVRIALGAATGQVMRMILRDSMGMLAAGIVIGLPCAYLVGGWLRSLLFQLEPSDPWTIVLAFVVLSAVAVIAAWVPARRAARIDPAIALREG